MPLSPEIRSKILHVYLKRDKHTLTNISDLKDYIELGQGLKVTVDELTSMWEEYTNIQTQTAAAAAAPAAFFSSTRNASLNRSILDDINIMLDILKQRAALVANKPFVEGFNWCASDTDNKDYIEGTQVSIELGETDHTAKRLYAITTIIDEFVSRLQEQHQRKITLFCDDDLDCLRLRARYTPAAKQESNTALMAPIASFPFDELKTTLNDGVMELFLNWQQDANDSNTLFMNTDMRILENDLNNSLSMLQFAYNEIDKKFTLEKKLTVAQQIITKITVNKEAMNQLSRIITGKDLIIEPSLQERSVISPR